MKITEILNNLIKTPRYNPFYEYGIFYNGKYDPNRTSRRSLISGNVQVLWFKESEDVEYNWWETVHKSQFKHFKTKLSLL